jgi:hypothetical protein
MTPPIAVQPIGMRRSGMPGKGAGEARVRGVLQAYEPFRRAIRLVGTGGVLLLRNQLVTRAGQQHERYVGRGEEPFRHPAGRRRDREGCFDARVAHFHMIRHQQCGPAAKRETGSGNARGVGG